MGAVVVKARFDSTKLDTDLWRVRRNDVGILRWKSHPKHRDLLVPYVVWDRDPEKKARKATFSSIKIIGLQGSTLRVLLLPVSR
jgi:hypothetical protein